MRSLVLVAALLAPVTAVFAQTPAQAARPTPALAESPTITVLKGFTVPQFEAEMQMFVQALGVNCGYCHVRGTFTSDEKAQKLTARRMIEMVQGINKQFFPDHKPRSEESTLGKVTCFTCHQGNIIPKASVAQ